jgi:enoyl-CoA hydratase/carnithine racemase
MNGIRLGIPLPATALEIVRESMPAANLAYVLYSGELFKANEALKLGLVNEIVSRQQLLEVARKRLQEFTQHTGNPAAILKTALRKSTLERIKQSAEEIREKFLETWFGPIAHEELAKRRDELLTKR